MLDRMRKSSQSVVIYAIFGLLILIFVISFGPQSRGISCESTMANDHYAAKVAGTLVTRNDFRYGFLVLGGAQYPAQMAKQQRLKETVMDKLIERQLLADEAERLGYAVSDEQVEDQVAEAKLIGLGYPRTAPRMMKDGKFNYDAFKNFVQYELGVTPQSFIEEQKIELLAARVRELLRASVTVSPAEVKEDFLRKNLQVNLEYVRFASHGVADDVQPTDAEIADYAAKNEAALKTAYDERKFIYEKVPKELRLRQIMLKVAPDAKPDADKAARAKMDALAARVKKGESFAAVAKEASDDPIGKARGGDLGWRGHGATNLPGDPEKQLFAAKPGDVIGPLKGSGGYYLTKVEDAREGTIPFEKVKLELAEEKVRAEKAGAESNSRAQAAITRAKADPAKTLKDLFPAPAEDDKDKDQPGKSAAPRAEETGLFSPRGTREGAMIEGIGVSNDLAKAAFALTTAAPLAGPFQVAGSWIIVRLKERKDPDMAEFEKKKDELTRDAELTKWIEVQTDWTQARCLEAKSHNRIQINREELRYEDSGEPPVYEPCQGRRQLGG
ncbi:MAG TPA: SurA N-terminal domain-containing protein [Polyangia bacterium]|jgi:peptidyl-prolyl cis-trans isomerase D|nr:SurA N-terminal domain-containing protein [Polyangia bacterium]